MERFSTVFRNLLYDNRWPTWHNDVILGVFSLGILTLGLFVFRRFEGRMAEEL